MKIVNFGNKSVNEKYVRENVYNFKFEGEGIYSFYFCDIGVYKWEKVSNNNEVEVLEEEDIIKMKLEEGYKIEEISKWKEFIFGGFEDDDLGNKDLRYVLWMDECDNIEYYYVK